MVYLAPADNVSIGCEHVDDFSFALVAPLRAEDNRDLA